MQKTEWCVSRYVWELVFQEYQVQGRNQGEMRLQSILGNMYFIFIGN